MKKPFAVRGLSNFALLAMLGGLVGGCSLFRPHPEFPPVTVNINEKTIARLDGQLLRKCTPPERGSSVAAPGECQGLRRVNVLGTKTITVITVQTNPVCYVFAWEGSFFELCMPD